MTENRIYNFSAGPATLPEEVLKQAQEDIWNIKGSGIGILEHSHRGKVFDAIIKEVEADCRELGGIPESYDVLFLQGGATLQFGMIPQAFLNEGDHLDVIHTGIWTKNAMKDAKLFGKVHYAYDGTDSQFDHIPEDSEIHCSEGAKYVHYCANNTIYGTEWQRTPKTDAPLIADTSSNMYSKPIEIEKHAMIFAGAQKNLGAAGCCLVIVNKEFLEKNQKDNLPLLLNYKALASKQSMLNTPPTFSIYIMGLVFKWIKKLGGLVEMEKMNIEKAKILRDAIDAAGGFYTQVGRADSRSNMNVCFRTPNADLDALFVKEALEAGFSGLKGHRDVGGLRASVYNAFPKQGCTALGDFLKEFARKNG